MFSFAAAGGQTRVFDKDAIVIGKDFSFETLDCDAELDKYPIDNDLASCVVSFEILEHFAGDPMNLVSESNRILKNNGIFCITTPNVISRLNLVKIALGKHPFGWSVFTDSYADRHNREYTPSEVKKLIESGGFEINLLKTFNNEKKKQSMFLSLFGSLLSLPAYFAGKVPLGMRGSHILVCAKKVGQVRNRYPDFLYEMYGANEVKFKIPLTKRN